ncbi:MAG TPA: hypothetical protein VM008_02665 [Phycisphaerae bacterium]|nr:hypothetical protein [Phycisphaerae bacterium]
MTVGTFKLGGREYVIVPKREYEQLAARIAEDARDVKRAKSAMRHYRKTGRGVTLEKLKRELGW